MVADVLGRAAPDRAQEFASYYDSNNAKVEGLLHGGQPAANGGPILDRGYRDERRVSWNVDALNGVNTAPAFATVTLEDIAKWNPDIIVCRDAVTQTPNPRRSAVEQHHRVRNHRV